ncbi:MAG: hypothetical protein AAGI10_01165 [Pseudomonadota bacterium]
MLNYDIDIHFVIPKEIAGAQEHAQLFQDIGFNADARGNYVAMFRDPAVATALQGASPELKTYLKASGFSELTSGRSLPPGTYDAEGEAQFMDVCARLAQNAGSYDLRGAHGNGFDVQALYRHLVAMRPITHQPVKEWSPPRPSAIVPTVFPRIGVIFGAILLYAILSMGTGLFDGIGSLTSMNVVGMEAAN